MPAPLGDDTRHVVALWRLQAAYADVISRRAFAELHDLFLPGAVVELDTVTGPVRRLVGSDALAAFVQPAIERFDHFTFVILNSVVDVVVRPEDAPSGGRATGRIFMCELRHDPESDSWPNAHGLYEDEYAWDADRWWIAGRRYRSLARLGEPTAVFGLPAGLPPVRR